LEPGDVLVDEVVPDEVVFDKDAFDKDAFDEDSFDEGGFDEALPDEVVFDKDTFDKVAFDDSTDDFTAEVASNELIEEATHEAIFELTSFEESSSSSTILFSIFFLYTIFGSKLSPKIIVSLTPRPLNKIFCKSLI
jgi:hypothetical protein